MRAAVTFQPNLTQLPPALLALLEFGTLEFGISLELGTPVASKRGEDGPVEPKSDSGRPRPQQRPHYKPLQIFESIANPRR